ncbi:hypothetical protein [Rahnella aceris]|uniref:hypothetical protein n=1 Tax=Rahnella sp. (strain Y9602) TaxID=2703885 RepID=UPI003FCFA831
MKEPQSGKISSLSPCYLKHSQRAERAVKEPEILKRRGDRRLLRPVWVATQGLDLEVEVEVKVKVKVKVKTQSHGQSGACH